jgi:hypothetical protein
MNFQRKFAVLAFVLTFSVLLPGARADEEDQATKLIFDHAVQIPGRDLPKGAYWFVVSNDLSRQYIVRIYSSDRKELIATLMTGFVERKKTTDKTAITFVAGDPTQPEAIARWFYPGRKTGHEFLYSKQKEKELALGKREPVVVGD